ncbi:MAG TPA: DUF4199 domain-containing protein [Chitinophagales bacterium]|nr:DUF4199 domain-containing protein [Chitinophagales bacterium]
MQSKPIFWGLGGGILGCSFLLIIWQQQATNYLNWAGMGSMFWVMLSIIGMAYNAPLPPRDVVAFRKLLKPGFSASLIALAILSIFHYLLYNYIDPSMPETYRQWMMEQIKAEMNQPNAPTQKLQQELAEWQTADLKLTLGGALQRFVFFIFTAFFLAAVTTLIALNTRKWPKP